MNCLCNLFESDDFIWFVTTVVAVAATAAVKLIQKRSSTELLFNLRITYETVFLSDAQAP